MRKVYYYYFDQGRERWVEVDSYHDGVYYLRECLTNRFLTLPARKVHYFVTHPYGHYHPPAKEQQLNLPITLTRRKR